MIGIYTLSTFLFALVLYTLTRAGHCMPFILVILGEFLALVFDYNYVWKARRLAWKNFHIDVHFLC